jgi:four helix bundle protein
MKDFKDLKVWERSHHLTLSVYKATANFPREELYGLTSQIRRASASIPTNIAEGCGRNTDNELARFLEIAMGSASELEYLLRLSNDLNFLDKADSDGFTTDVIEIKKMLASFIRNLRADR